MKKKWIIVLGITALAAAALLLARETGRRKLEAEAAAGQAVEIDILMSTGGDSLRREYAQRRFDGYEAENPGTKVNATYVDSDTLAFLKLLYAGNGSSYDVVCMSDDAMLSAVEQKLIYPMDELLMERLGLNWLGSLPEPCMVNTTAEGKIYGLPFIKSRLNVYVRQRSGGEEGPVSLEELAQRSGPGRKAAIPVDVLIRDLLLSAESSGWDQLSQVPEKYQVDTPENRRLLRLMKEKLLEGGLVPGDYGELVEAFCSGAVDAVILEDIYEDELREKADFPYIKTELMRSGDVPWIDQGCNLYLTNLGVPHDYLPAWKLVEFLTLGESHGEGQERERDLTFKRVLSLKNTKVRLIVDRMIAEYLHGEKSAEELLENLQNQIGTVSQQ